MKRKDIQFLCAVMLILTFISGCKFVRPTDADKFQVNGAGTVIGNNVPVDDGKISVGDLLKPDTDGTQTSNLPITENPVSIVIDQGNAIDPNALLAFFFEESTDDLLTEGCLQLDWSEDGELLNTLYCDKDNVELLYAEQSDGKYLIFAWDNNGNAGRCYEEAFPFYFVSNEISQRLMELYPEEDLESCSREEAIAFCAPLAKACGYGDAQVNVYAMTKEVLNDFPERAKAFDMGKELDPPYSNSEPTITMAEIRKAEEAGDEKLANELRAKREEELARKTEEWTDETEAYLVVYRSVLNGRLFDTTEFAMMCVYVPAYQKVVWVEGQRSSKVVETLEEVELISEEEALAEALRVIKVDSVEKITLKGISMVYSPRYEQAGTHLKRRIVDPCWRIDYQLSDELKENATVAYHNDGTVLINAVDGRENKYPRG